MGAQCSKVMGGDQRSRLLAAVHGSKNVEERITSFVAGVSLFSYLEFEDHDMIAACLEEKNFADKEEVVHEGDAGDVMYIVESGKAAVSVGNENVAKLSAGDYFGEFALLWDQPRSATVTAKGKLTCLALTRERFDGLELKSILHFPKRKCLHAGEAEAEKKKKQPHHKSKKSIVMDGEKEMVAEEEVKFIADCLHKNGKLNEAMEFQRETLEAMARACKVGIYKQGDVVIKQGDKVAEEMYIVKEGTLSISLMDNSSEGSKRGTVEEVGKYGPGESFGELALLFDAPRAATILGTTEAVTLYTLKRSAFKLAVRSIADRKVSDVAEFVATVPCLAGLNAGERLAVAEAFIAVDFHDNEEICRKGDKSKDFMILQRGEVQGAKNSDRWDKAADLLGCADFLEECNHSMSLKAGHDGALIFLLDRESFKTFLSGCDPLIREAAGLSAGEKGAKVHKKTTILSPDEVSRCVRFGDAEFNALNKIRILGTGGFGVVWLVESKGGSCCTPGHGLHKMAMKVIQKGLVERERVQLHVQNERKVLAICADNPLFIHMYGTHKDPDAVYFLMEVATMDLLQAYAENKLFGNEKVCAYHVASLACALEHLHVRRIAYRDVKPENMLINSEGRMKVCDMGIAKFIPGLTYSVIGTPEYCAPEVFTGQGYNMSCDWWALGVLTFELMTGGNPFNKGGDILDTIKSVKKGFSGPTGNNSIPFYVEKKSPDVVDLIKKICHKIPKHRLPVGKSGQDDTHEFKEHIWFKGIAWDKIANASLVEPPFVPDPKGKEKKEPRPEDMPEEVPGHKEKCDWDEHF